MRKILSALVLVLLAASLVCGEVRDGKLQLHFIYVGQGDAAILISPLGETVLFDNGIEGYCDRTISYLRKLGVSQITHHVASHYHGDHIACTQEVLGEFPLQEKAYDRGVPEGNPKYYAYYNGPAVEGKRKEVIQGAAVTLDDESDHPVTIKFVAINGAGLHTSNENDLSAVAVITFGKFKAVMGGDLSGFNKAGYTDIETTVADKVGPVDVYKVHHHCSRYSSNKYWLQTTKPKVGIISASSQIGIPGFSDYGHPTADCLGRLHKNGVKCYWTERTGSVEPNPELDVIGGDIKVEVEPGANEFKVIHDANPQGDTYLCWN